MKLICDFSVTSRRHRPGSARPQPTLRLDFTNQSFHPISFGAAVTFTRAGSARYHDASGVMQTAPADAPRFDHDRGTGLSRGLLIEDTRTNLFLQSETAANQSVSVTPRFYALSFWGSGNITLSGAHVATIAGLGGNTRAVAIFYPTTGPLTLTLSGNVLMVQLEAGNCATSYIPTTTTPITRVADKARLPLGAWWNPQEGSFLVEWQDINQQAANTRILGLHGSLTALNLTAGSGPGGNNSTRLQMWNGSAALDVTAANAELSKGVQRGAAAWSATGRSLAAKGVVTTSATPLFSSGSLTDIFLGHTSGGSASINGCLRSISYFAKRLSDMQLTSLTQ